MSKTTGDTQASTPRREPPVLEAKAETTVTHEPEAAPVVEPTETAMQPPGETAAAAAAPARSARWPLLVAALFGAAIAVPGVLYVGGNSGLLGDAQNGPANFASGELEARLKANDAAMQATLERQGKDFAAAQAQAKASLEAAQQAKAALESQLAAALAKAAQAPAANAAEPVKTDPTAPDLSAALAELTQKTRETQAGLAAMAQRLAPLETALGAVKDATRATEARGQGADAGLHAAALAVISQSILAALDSGAPFQPEIAALEALGADAGTIAPLKALSQTGAPGTAALAAQIKGLSSTIMTVSSGKSDKPQSFMERIGQSAANLVKVRRAGDAGGEDPSALLVAIADDLRQNKAADALAAWQKLPDAAKKASQPWGNAIQSRIAATVAARALLANAIAGLGTQKS